MTCKVEVIWSGRPERYYANASITVSEISNSEHTMFDYYSMGLACESYDTGKDGTWGIDLKDEVKDWLDEYAYGEYEYTRLIDGNFADALMHQNQTLTIYRKATAVMFKLKFHELQRNTQDDLNFWQDLMTKIVTVRSFVHGGASK